MGRVGRYGVFEEERGNSRHGHLLPVYLRPAGDLSTFCLKKYSFSHVGFCFSAAGLIWVGEMLHCGKCCIFGIWLFGSEIGLLLEKKGLFGCAFFFVELIKSL